MKGVLGEEGKGLAWEEGLRGRERVRKVGREKKKGGLKGS